MRNLGLLFGSCIEPCGSLVQTVGLGYRTPESVPDFALTVLIATGLGSSESSF